MSNIEEEEDQVLGDSPVGSPPEPEQKHIDPISNTNATADVTATTTASPPTSNTASAKASKTSSSHMLKPATTSLASSPIGPDAEAAIDSEVQRRVEEQLREAERLRQAAIDAEIEKRVQEKLQRTLEAAREKERKLLLEQQQRQKEQEEQEQAIKKAKEHEEEEAKKQYKKEAAAVKNKKKQKQVTPPSSSSSSSSSDEENETDEEKEENPQRFSPPEDEGVTEDLSIANLSTSVIDVRGGVEHSNGVFKLNEDAPATIAERCSAAEAGFTARSDPLDGYDAVLSAELRVRGYSEEDLPQLRMGTVATEDFVTVREEGRCGAPAVEDSQIPPNTHVALQMNFFRSPQHIAYLRKGPFVPNRLPVIPDRQPKELVGGDGRVMRPFSKASLEFETDLIQRPDLSMSDEDEETVESSDDNDSDSDDPENLKRKEQRRAARMAALQQKREQRCYADRGIESPDDATAVPQVGGSFTFPDPLHMWELTRGKRFTLPPDVLAQANTAASNTAKSSTTETNNNNNNNKSNNNSVTSNPEQARRQQELSLLRSQLTNTEGASTQRIYTFETLDVNAFRKPVPAVAMFNNGFVLQIDLKNVASQLRSVHGDVDPLFLTCCVYSISATGTIRLSEDFHASFDTERFFPHKSPATHSNLKRFILFIPEEHRKSPLVLIIRVHRLACDDFETYCDLYNRPEKYNYNKHVTPMMQETQQFAMLGDVLQELGWCYFHLNDRNGMGKVSTGEMMVEKIFRSYKVFRVGFLTPLIQNPAQQATLYTVPMKVTVECTDVSGYETAFPNSGNTPLIEETESVITIQNPEKLGAERVLCRHVMSPLLILSSGYFNAYSNVLYVRLHSLKLTAQHLNSKQSQFPTSHRNFFVQVCLKATDDSFSEEGLPLVYGRSLCKGFFETSAVSTTFTGLREFDMEEEVKIQLPPYITSNHHLFFTFWAINLKKGSTTTGSGTAGGPPRAIKIGYSVLPIMSDSGVLFSKDGAELGMVLPDTASAWGAGYLKKWLANPTKDMAANGATALTLTVAARSSIHVTGQALGQSFEAMQKALPCITRDDGYLWNGSGLLAKTCPSCPATDPLFFGQFRSINTLQLPEALAFFPMLCSYHLSVIASPSCEVSLQTRRLAFRSLIRIAHMVHNYDCTTKIQFRRVGMPPNKPLPADIGPPASRTSVARTLYTFLSNCLLFTKQPFPLAQGVAEVWLAELKEVMQQCAGSPTPEQNMYSSRMSELSWFFLDIMVRSSYLMPEEKKNRSPTAPSAPHPSTGSRSNRLAPASSNNGKQPLFDKSYYAILEDLLTTLIQKETPMSGTMIVSRVFLFIRQLLLGGDCGQVLALARAVLVVINAAGNTTATASFVQAGLRVFTESEDAYLYALPNSHCSTRPQYMLSMLLEFLSPHLLNKAREVRSGAIYTLYNFAVRLVNNKRVAGHDVEAIATSMYSFVHYMSQHWREFAALSTDPIPQKGKPTPPSTAGGFGVSDRRCVLSLVLWIIFHGGVPALRSFIRTAGGGDVTSTANLTPQHKDVLAGLSQMLGDAQNLFRYHRGTDKIDCKPLPDQMPVLEAWDARYSTFVNFIGSLGALMILREAPAAMRLVGCSSKTNPHVYPYFLLLEGIVSINNSALGLMCGAAVLFQATVALFPELISGKATYIPGMILLSMRVMSFCPRHARRIAVRCLGEIAYRYYLLCGGMGRMKSHMANSLVGVAESRGRDMSRAGTYILSGLEAVSERLKVLESSDSGLDKEYKSRFIDEGNTASVSSGMKYDYFVPDQAMSVDRLVHHKLAPEVIAAANAATTGNGVEAFVVPSAVAPVRQPASVEFAAMADSMVLLFKSVLRLQQDDAMKFKETKCAAYHQIVLSFFNQSAVAQGFKWLQRLHETHRSNEDHAEAALVSILSAALAFRITEVFFDVKGTATEGARMPYSIFTHVLWHDYVRIVPEIEQLIPLQAVYTVVKDMTVVSNETIFTIDGQIHALQGAAGLLDKANYAELSAAAAIVAAKFAAAKGDYVTSAALHASVSTLYGAINSTSLRRTQHRYYVLWARMEMAQPPVKRKRAKGDATQNDRSSNSNKALPQQEQNAYGGSNMNPNEGEEASGHDVQRRAKYLSDPIKRIYKVPYNVDKVTFQQQAMQVVSAMLENPQDVVLTDDGTDTVPYQKPKKHKASNKTLLTSPRSSPGKQASPSQQQSTAATELDSAARCRRCLLTVQEVVPHFTAEEMEQLRPYQQRCNAIDKTMFLGTFESVAHVGIDKITKGAEAAVPGTHKVVKQVSQFDPLDQRLEQRVYKLSRAFPCTTTAIEVVSTETKVLDAYDTAVDLIRSQTTQVEELPNNPQLVSKLHHSLTPFGIVPAGQYYKQVVLGMASNRRIAEAVTQYIAVCKKRMDDCLQQGAMERAPDQCANILKAIADIECVMLTTV